MAAIVLEGTASVPLIEGMPDGKALLWVYLYGSSDADLQLLALVQGSPGTLLPWLLGLASQLGLPVPLLPTPFVDSDVAVAAAEASGGADFRLAVSNAVLVAMLAGLFAPWRISPNLSMKTRRFRSGQSPICSWITGSTHLKSLSWPKHLKKLGKSTTCTCSKEQS